MGASMDAKIFKKLFQEHVDKLSQAWIKLSDKEMKRVNGDLKVFLEVIAKVYNIPNEIILRELDAVQKNIDAGINSDYAPHLDPRE